jgi:hypothetical protein
MDGIKDAATVEFYKEAKPLKIESPLILIFETKELKLTVV